MPSHATRSYVACPDCDLLVAIPLLEEGESGECKRCGALLQQNSYSIALLLALALAGLILWLASLLSPLLILQVNGIEQSVSLWQASVTMLEQDEWLLAILIAMTTLVAPLLQLALMLWLLLPVYLGFKPLAVGWLFRSLRFNANWLMLEIFFLGILVAAVKLADMADVSAGWSLFSFVSLMLVMTSLSVLFDADAYWRALDQCQ